MGVCASRDRPRPIARFLVAGGAVPFANAVRVRMELKLPGYRRHRRQKALSIWWTAWRAVHLNVGFFVPTDSGKGLRPLMAAGLSSIDHVTHNVFFAANLDKWPDSMSGSSIPRGALFRH